MVLAELAYFYKKHKALTVLFYIQLFLFFLIFGTFLAFVQQLRYEHEGMQADYAGKAMYQLMDDYREGQSYAAFNARPGSLDILKNYYGELDTAREFQYLTMFNHEVMLEDNGLPLNFVKGYENGNGKRQENLAGRPYTWVKSLQLNEQALRYFDLKTYAGRIWSQSQSELSPEVLPVMLGYDYRELYEVGQQTSINYYGTIQKVEVIGILAENTRVYYADRPEFYLDDSIVIPYVAYGPPENEGEAKFQTINYFARVNGYVVLEDDPQLKKEMLQRIDALASSTGFGRYSFIGLNPHFQNYRGLMVVIQENEALVKSLFAAFVILNVVVINLFLFMQQKRRFPMLAVHYLNGATRFQLVKLQALPILSIFGVTCCVNFIIMEYYLKIGDLPMQFVLFGVAALMGIFACALPIGKFLSRPMSEYIKTEE
ncbi:MULTISPECIES: hypothetical protein [Saccharibacillus]|uniref:hypothetical protein n=1 Tax=Saccharibacillus TaxID=456492 RepID=UPI001238941E|nr:hypothetical protein [Saccharibacillus sp. WB 17]MWJ30689.1 hypothetical protein [Saccharibacillus sp. WB 17]